MVETCVLLASPVRFLSTSRPYDLFYNIDLSFFVETVSKVWLYTSIREQQQVSKILLGSNIYTYIHTPRNVYLFTNSIHVLSLLTNISR